MYAKSFIALDGNGRLTGARTAQAAPYANYTCHLCGSALRYPTITIRGQLSDNMVYTEKHIRIISVTTAAAIHPVIGSSENDVQLRTRHPETTAD